MKSLKEPKPTTEKAKKVKSKEKGREKQKKKGDRDDLNENIIGKSKSIEKPYLRITGCPDPETIRP